MKRKDKALEVLRAGGYFRRALETQYRGGEKFVYRLRDAAGNVIPGIGYQTWRELHEAGLLSWRESARSSTWPTEWVLSDAGKAAAYDAWADRKVAKWAEATGVLS